MIDQDGLPRAVVLAHTRARRPGPPDFARHKGGSTTTVVPSIPAKTPEELSAISKQNELFDIQIGELKRQNAALEAIFPEQQKLLQAQTQAAIDQADFSREQLGIARRQGDLQERLVTKAIADLEGTPEEQQIRKLSNDRALAILRGEAPPLLPGQQERINTIFGAARDEATGELTRFGEDIATSRGLRVTDSPIGNELLRQKRTLEQNLAAGKAGAELNVGQAEQQFGEAVRQFQENLRQQAFQNRLALTGNVGGGSRLPIGSFGMTPTFAGTTLPAAQGGINSFLDVLTRDRLAGASQTSTTRTGPSDVTGALIGAGGVLGAAALMAPIGTFRSSARFKTGILPYDPDEYDRALAKLNATPVTRWKYRWEPASTRLHTGPILELAPDDIKASDTHLDLLSYTGLVHAAVKAVDRKVERFSQALAAAVAEAA